MCKLIAIAALLALAAAGPARALPPEESTGPDGSASPAPEMASPAPAGESGPYTYPAGTAPSVDWVPPDGWRYPAVAGDALLVRPLMVISLIGGGALFVATLPISAATCTTEDWLHTLRDRAHDTFRRPLGAF